MIHAPIEDNVFGEEEHFLSLFLVRFEIDAFFRRIQKLI